MILKDGFIQPERLSLVTLDRPTHYPMGSRRGDPADVIKETVVASTWQMCYIVSKLKKTQKGKENGKGDIKSTS